ncbi:MAG: 2-C-methyl-D-erythritol 4-phosphate cytidylyltransferase [Deltaproteobacteria bacterium]|jgi:2-C-methyl-D-erythritol 4-phosphate cytidylyltransferase/2-C-methyl-D-erythritol 2,4-cyclodiphosphate synthase|nr:2-C-methyl-D-erythritol 4-phosphate cytidylyltransferase [Deltaproteobacteria bacterium]
METIVSAVIVAGGRGLRYGGEEPKQLALLAGRPVLARSLSPFLSHPDVDEVILVVPQGQRSLYAGKLALDSRVLIAEGGEFRTQSVLNGLKAARADSRLILVHDGVRPLVTRAHISEIISLTETFGAAVLAVPVRDTLKAADNGGRILKTVDRTGLYGAQTPQGFKREILQKALELGAEKPAEATDESVLAEELGYQVRISPGSAENIKITYPEDLLMAEAFLSARAGFRVGQGFDFHAFEPSRPLWLGGILIKDQPGLLGHSDADVLAHALADSLLGAAGLGDIGEHFPPGEPEWAGLSGAALLSETMDLVTRAGYVLVNCDLTLIGESPRIGPYKKAMIAALALALGVNPEVISLKATTTEKMGFTGRGEGLAASGLVLLTGPEASAKG